MIVQAKTPVIENDVTYDYYCLINFVVQMIGGQIAVAEFYPCRTDENGVLVIKPTFNRAEVYSIIVDNNVDNFLTDLVQNLYNKGIEDERFV